MIDCTVCKYKDSCEVQEADKMVGCIHYEPVTALSIVRFTACIVVALIFGVIGSKHLNDSFIYGVVFGYSLAVIIHGIRGLF